MNSPVPWQTWRRSAGFGMWKRILFPEQSSSLTIDPEAFPSNTRTASYCQNRYPSPSGWSGSHPRAWPPDPFSVRRSAAEQRDLIQIRLVKRGSCNVFDRQGHKALHIGGNRTCKRNSRSSPPQRCSAWRGVTLVPISSAPSSAAQSAVRPARSTKTANASRALRSVPQRVHWQTTSENPPFRARNDNHWAVPALRRAALIFAASGATGVRRGTCSRKS